MDTVIANLPILDDPEFLDFCKAANYEWNTIQPIVNMQYPHLFDGRLVTSSLLLFLT
jgi:hypothetical protein